VAERKTAPFKGLLAVCVVLGTAGTSWTMPSPAKILSAVPSAAGGTVWSRFRACGLKVRREGTWAEQVFQDSAPARTKKGDWIVQVWVDMPRPVETDMVLIWNVRGGKAMAQTGWADRLQNSREIPELTC
jgi:hypothetical protein